MAYMSQEKKASIAPTVKAILKRYGVKGSLSVRGYSTLVLTLKSGTIDFIANSNKVCGANQWYVSRGFKPNTSGYCDVNPYWYQDHYDGVAKQFISEVMAAMNAGNHDNSDIQTDYFDVGWYVDIKIGKWNQPYIVTE